MTTCNVGQSSFLLINKSPDWERGLRVNLEVSEDGISIARNFVYVIEREIELEQIREGFQVTDFAIGEGGLIYILDSAAASSRPNIWVYDPNQNRF